MTERNLPVATIEIFQDRDNVRHDVSRIHEGIGIVQAITGGLEVIDDTRKIKIANEGARHVVARNIRWPQFLADMNIVVTEKAIQKEAITRASTVEKRKATDGTAVTGLGVVLIAARSPRASTTTAHELGHLFGLKTGGSLYAPHSLHCADVNCLMHPVVLEKPSDELDNMLDVIGVKRFLGGFLKNVPQRATNYQTDFCFECVRQLRHAANVRALGKL